MLILTRKIGEIVRIGDDVTVRVLGVRGGQVSLGFSAPSDVRIFREEVLEADRAAAAARSGVAGGKRPVDRSTDTATARGGSADGTRTGRSARDGRPRSNATRPA